MRMLRVLLFALTWTVLSSAMGDILRQPERAASWRLEVQQNASATITEEQGALRFDITRVGGENWSIQAYQLVQGLRSNTTYNMRFRARASSPRPLQINVQVNEPPWTSVSRWQQPSQLTPQWQEFTVALELTEAAGREMRMPVFLLAEATGTVWISDVWVGTGRPPPIGPTVPGAVVPPVGGVPPVIPPAGGVPLVIPPGPTVPAAIVPTVAIPTLLPNPLEPRSWRLEQHAGAIARVEQRDGILNVSVDQASHASEHLLIYLLPEIVSPGAYTLEMIMRADPPRTVPFAVTRHATPTDILVPLTSISVDDQWKRYRIRFAIQGTSPGDVRLPVLQIGDTRGNLQLQEITLTGP